MGEINFTCPSCKYKRIDKRYKGLDLNRRVWESTLFLSVNAVDTTIMSNERVNDERVLNAKQAFQGYYCRRCDLKLASTSDELYLWLYTHRMLKNDYTDDDDFEALVTTLIRLGRVSEAFYVGMPKLVKEKVDV